MHINYKRGETRNFVWRREHWRMPHRGWHKGKRDTHKWWKQTYNRKERHFVKKVLKRDEDCQEVEVVHWRDLSWYIY